MTPRQQLLNGLLAAHRRGNRLILLFDYDGTLVPIVEHPRLATLDPGARRLLRRLAGQPRVHLGILSGRSVDDLKQMVRLPKIYYAGNSGLEVELYGVRLAHPRVHGARKLVARTAERLLPLVAAFPGGWIENKGLGLTVHYRAVAKDQIPALRRHLQETLRAVGDRVRPVEGPMALEITPNLGWSKGTALQIILDHLGADDGAVLYAGDGANDAEAMQVVAAQGGAAVGIGPDPPPGAQHRLPDHASLLGLLGDLDASLAMQRSRAASPATKALAIYGLWKPSLPTTFM